MTVSNIRYGFQRRLYASRISQTTWGTAVLGGVGSTYIFDLLATNPPIMSDAEMFDDAGMATGREFPRQQWYGTKKSLGTISMRASVEAIGFWMGYAMGSQTVSGAVDKKHSTTLRTIGTAPKFLTIQQQLFGTTEVASHDWKFVDVVVNSVELTWGATGFVTLNVELLGSGLTAAAADLTESNMVTIADGSYIQANKMATSLELCSVDHTSEWDGTFTEATTPGVFANIDADVSEHMLTGSVKMSNNFTEESMQRAGKSSGAGITGEVPHSTRRTIESSIELRKENATKALADAWVSGTNADNIEYSLLHEFVTDAEIGGGQIYSGLVALPCVGQQARAASSGGLEATSDAFTFFAKEDLAQTPLEVYTIDAEASIYGNTS